MYLSKNDLISHIPFEILTEITRDYKEPFADLVAFPAEGITGKWYYATDTEKYYKWDGNVYVETPYVDLIEKAINDGISEVKAYLNRYDLIKMFSDDDGLRTFNDEYLNGLVKDIVCWKLLKLSNPNIDLKLFRTNYEDAKSTLAKVQNGRIDPVWPLRPNDPDTNIDDAGNVEWASNPRRSNYF